jgi:hypothetical protein
MKSRLSPDSLPILTETADGSPLDLPMLTELVEENPPTSLQLSDKQCQKIAEQLFPRLEIALLNALNASAETTWQTAMHQLRTTLPELILSASRQPLLKGTSNNSKF